MITRADSKKYDVAISFLFEDLALAQALNDKLTKGLSVFFFPGKQEVLAGTDGLESMRAPFVDQSRLNVVLYKEKWGNTPWTAVEATAIKDSCLANAYRNLFFFVIEPTTVLPTWLPDTHVYFSYGVFTLNEAVGAIKARVQERGGHYIPLTPLKKAELLKAEELYQSDKARMTWTEGLEASRDKVDELINEMARHFEEIAAAGDVQIEYETHHRAACLMRHQQVSMIVRWEQSYVGSMQKGGLSVEEYDERLYLSRDTNRLYTPPPKITKHTLYDTDLSRSREYGWANKKTPSDFISSATLAEKLVLQFMELIERSRKPPRS